MRNITIQTPYIGDARIDCALANIYKILNDLQKEADIISKSKGSSEIAVTDTDSIDLTINGQQSLSAETIGFTGTITFVE